MDPFIVTVGKLLHQKNKLLYNPPDWNNHLIMIMPGFNLVPLCVIVRLRRTNPFAVVRNTHSWALVTTPTTSGSIHMNVRVLDGLFPPVFSPSLDVLPPSQLEMNMSICRIRSLRQQHSQDSRILAICQKRAQLMLGVGFYMDLNSTIPASALYWGVLRQFVLRFHFVFVK